MTSPRPHVGVVGPGEATTEETVTAEDVGRRLAAAGAVLLTGGLGGVMAAACRGAATEGGLTVALLAGTSRAQANEWVNVGIPTGLGELRNGLIVRAADVLIAVGGGYGTLSEVALALKTGVPVLGLSTWPIDGVIAAGSAAAAVEQALELAT